MVHLVTSTQNTHSHIASLHKITCNDVLGSTTTTRNFIVSLVVNVIIAIVVLLLFEIFRNSRPLIYKPRCYIDGFPQYAMPSKVWSVCDCVCVCV